MKLRITKSALVEGVSQVSKAVSQKTTIPILTGVKVGVDEKGLLLTGSNSDVTIQKRILKRVEDDKEQVIVDRMGSVVVPGKILGEIVRKLPGDWVEWSVNDRYQVIIQSGQTEFQLNGLDPEQYPSLPHLSTTQIFTLSADVLRSIIRQTGFAVAANESRGVFTGVLLQVKEGKLTCVATDSHRLSRRVIEVEGPEELDLHNVIVPGKSMAEMAKTFADYDGYVDIVVADNQILVQNQHLAFYSRLIDGNYPDTNRVIPAKGEIEVVTSTRELLQSVERASLISRDGRDNVIKWTIGEEKIEVTSASQELGSVVEEVMATVTGNEIGISFNARFMIDALRAIESEEIQIQFTGAMTPFIIQPLNQDQSLHLIVPMRTH